MSDPFVHFKVMVKERASDLILREGERPAIRVEGKIRFLSDERFTPEESEALLAAILSAEEIATFRVLMEKDVAFVVPGVGRFRANLFVQRKRFGFVFRHVHERVPSIEELHLPGRPLSEARAAAPRARPRHGHRGLGQVDDAGRRSSSG